MYILNIKGGNMEISNISGPDVVPSGFTVETPRNEQVEESNNNYNNNDYNYQTPNEVDETKGTNFDTYA